MFIIKFKDGTQAIVYDIHAWLPEYVILVYYLNGRNIYTDIDEIDKIVRYFE